MIILVLAWLYITLLCRAWGILVLRCIRFFTGEAQLVPAHFSILCFTGFAGIAIVSCLLSLFIPLGGWMAQLLILLPCSVFLVKKEKRGDWKKLTDFFRLAYPAFLVLGLCCLLLLLYLCSSLVDNDDTLGYHAQLIQWIEKYKAVPGIVNLHIRYGQQSNWFVSAALFSFRFLGLNAFTFVNSVVLLWYFIFLTERISHFFHDPQKRSYAFFWIALLAFSLWNFNLVRQTAISANPDFIAVLYTWLPFYLVLTRKKADLSGGILLLIILLGLFAFTIKLSAAPVLIMAISAGIKLIRLRKIRALVFCLGLSLIILVPFGVRNIISSGYVLYPATYPDIANVDWKFNKDISAHWRKYITAFARIRISPEETDRVYAMKFSEWVPVWWKNQAVPDKSILAIAILSLLFILAGIKKLTRSGQNLFIALLTALAGIVFWFIKAPDPRFGYGFLFALPFIAIMLYAPELEKWNWEKLKKTIQALSILVASGILIYIVYKGKDDLRVSQFLLPAGISHQQFKPVQCGEITVNVAETLYHCGETGIPCACDSCKTFQPRGSKITDGFKSR
jgi:hypothetical protein